MEQQNSHDHAMLQDQVSLDLTPLECQLLEYIWRGYSTGMIAAALGMSSRMIEAYREVMFKKFNARNAMQMVRAALRQGLLEV